MTLGLHPLESGVTTIDTRSLRRYGRRYCKPLCKVHGGEMVFRREMSRNEP